MQTVSEKKKINIFLGERGLAQLDDPGLAAQLAYFVQDHIHFRQLLNRCEPEQRKAMYDAMSPHLRFDAKPLESYIIELKDEAARKRLPVVGEDGNLHEYVPPTVGRLSLEKLAEKGIHQNYAYEKSKGHILQVCCAKCTATAEFVGATIVSATMEARLAGWVYQEVDGKPQEICPKHPAARAVKPGNA